MKTKTNKCSWCPLSFGRYLEVQFPWHRLWFGEQPWQAVPICMLSPGEGTASPA